MSKYINLSGLKTLLEPLVHLINKKAERPDWNENDANSSSYITNRPFYTEKKEIEILNEALYFDSNGEVYFEGDQIKDTPFASELYENETYTVIWDGIEYKCIARKTQYEGEYYIGNQEFAKILQGIEFPEHIVSNEPFFIITYVEPEYVGATLMAAEGDHTVIINGPAFHVAIIDEKYLPPLVGKPGTGYLAEIFNIPDNIAFGDYSHAEGGFTLASGEHAHAEGYYTKAIGSGSHAEGGSTLASDSYAHAEGMTTKATGHCSHAEGQETQANGAFSHAEGVNAIADGNMSHAEGRETLAEGDLQHVQGQYNRFDTTSAHIVGNGNHSKRSNAHTLDWQGNAWYSGDVYVGSTSGTNKDEGSKKLATEEYVSTKAPVRNLLDNSDFEIAQAGYNGSHGNELYHADRWFGNGHGTLDVSGGVKTFTSTFGFAFMRQILWNDGRDHGKTYTLAITLPDGTRLVGSGKSPSAPSTSEHVFIDIAAPDSRCWFMAMKAENDTMYVRVDASQIGSAVSFLSIDLFEGEYTTESVPPHVPKGYAAELAECQRYFQRSFVILNQTATNYSNVAINLPVIMRTIPTITLTKEQGTVTSFSSTAVSRQSLYVSGTGINTYAAFSLMISADL